MRTTRAPTAPRAGLSLPELLIALTVLAVGVLAAAGTGPRLVRASVDAASAADAAHLLDARAESLPALPCEPAAGARRVGALDERWTVAVDGELLTLADSVGQAGGGAPRPIAALVARRWCEP